MSYSFGFNLLDLHFKNKTHAYVKKAVFKMPDMYQDDSDLIAFCDQ